MGRMIEDLRSEDGRWLGTFSSGGERFETRSYKAWHRIRSRCKVGGKFQRDKPSYVGCYVGGVFGDFQQFTDWHVRQVGYGIDGYALDKDILFAGNMEYSESKCVLAPVALNSFMTHRKSTAGKLPLGVWLDPGKGSYYASIYIGNKNTYLGRYATAQAAHDAYVKAKESEARRWAERLRNGEFVIDPRVITVLENWRLNG